MKFARKIYKILGFLRDICQMPEFYMIIVGKIFSRVLFWGEARAPCLPVSYAYIYTSV